MAQGFVSLIYAPMICLQLGLGYLLYHAHFEDLPQLYFMPIAYLVSIPCIVVACGCVVCTARYGRMDMALVRRQRLERGREADAKAPSPAQPPDEAQPSRPIVDCSESLYREWELIYSA